jgi:putative SOS response-associated peptidase YedK
MCGRYTTGTEIENIRFREIMEEANAAMKPGLRLADRPGGDVYPTDIAPAVIGAGEARRAVGMRWGFRSARGLVINARAETALEKPMFRESALERRCLLPAAGYYEWNARKERFLFRYPNREILYLAGLYRPGEDEVFEFAILTRDAYKEAREVHARMPLIIRDTNSWLFQKHAVPALLASGGDLALEITRQSPEQLTMF